jgi:hypothetical protein
LRIGDRIEISTGTGIFSDEEIQLMIDDEGSWQGACVACIQSILNILNTEPDSTADWLRIDLESARESYEKMLSELKAWLGVSGVGNTTTTTPSWRGDSLQTEAPASWEE